MSISAAAVAWRAEYERGRALAAGAGSDMEVAAAYSAASDMEEQIVSMEGCSPADALAKLEMATTVAKDEADPGGLDRLWLMVESARADLQRCRECGRC